MPTVPDIHRRDTRAAQPAATAVTVGTLYFVTDEGVTERSTGVAWESYSGAGGSGGFGDVVGPASSVDDRIATFDGVTGQAPAGRGPDDCGRDCGGNWRERRCGRAGEPRLTARSPSSTA